MICINCFHQNTRVVNSRARKKEPEVWRRRQCSSCETIFTTKELPSLADNKKVYPGNKKTEDFNLGKLILSIAKAFTHSKRDAEYNSLWLARSVESYLSSQEKMVTPEVIEAATHTVLKRYDELAAVQYAAQHGLISSVRRRGRPSLP